MEQLQRATEQQQAGRIYGHVLVRQYFAQTYYIPFPNSADRINVFSETLF